MSKIDFKNSIFIFIVVILILNAINIQSNTIDSLRDLLINLIFIIGYLFCYLGWKNRILLANYFLTIFYTNIQFTINKLVGIETISEEMKVVFNKVVFIFSALGLVLLLIGIGKKKIKYITDYIDLSLRKILWISVFFTLIFQLIIRFAIR